LDPILLSELNIYPIKSAKGVPLTSARVVERGLEHDRRWMVVDDGNRFLTQRTHPRMALMEVQVRSHHLAVSAPGMEELAVPFELKNPELLQVQVWDDLVEAESVGSDASAWLSRFLGIPCKLVHMPDHSARSVNPRYAEGRVPVSFADAFPFLLISESSLSDLNARLEQPVPMNRFRPSLVVKGCRPFEEDEWNEFQIGPVTFTIAKPCSRCTVPTVDQSTGIRGKEPIRTLETFRSREGKVLFGQNVVHRGSGVLAVGDPVHLGSRE
jgi:uncharacterized protein YcbX